MKSLLLGILVGTTCHAAGSTLNVSHGAGTGSYPEGSPVQIDAENHKRCARSSGIVAIGLPI